MKVLILGVSGMLGHTIFHKFINGGQFDVRGTVRNIEAVKFFFPADMLQRTIPDIDAFNIDSVKNVIYDFSPDIVINCIGIIKQLPAAKDAIQVITLNSLFPHNAAAICKEIGCRLIHISTDCVFDGKKGNYTEDDKLSADDLYGISKYMGEVNYSHTLTIRTSIIGHELNSKYSLIEWFLSQTGKVNGYTNAIYTGFPTVEIADIISEYVIPDDNLSGLYQISSNPISKYELLKLAAEIYDKKIKVHPFDDFYDNKSLVSDKFRNLTDYKPPEWRELVRKMYNNYIEFGYKRALHNL